MPRTTFPSITYNQDAHLNQFAKWTLRIHGSKIEPLVRAEIGTPAHKSTHMLTIFSTAKPFHGHSNIIQRNALTSWKLLHPEVEVILFGDEPGAAEASRDLGIRHEPVVLRNENGTKYLNYIFDRAYELSSHKFLCYANCDIMFTSDFLRALELVVRAHNQFLIVGQRWDTDIVEPWNFKQTGWDVRLRSLALQHGKRAGLSWVDYFCFSRDLYHEKMPPFLIGRWGWDPWLVWFARNSMVPLVDASRMVVAVHQNHNYAYLKDAAAPGNSAEAAYNWGLGDNPGVWRHYRVDAATERLVRGRLKGNALSWLGPIKSRATRGFYRIWFAGLNATRSFRHRVGKRGAAVHR
jgi:hypothetical protein